MSASVASPFSIEVLDLHWISGDDGKDDRCAHGHLAVTIGGEAVSLRSSGDWTVNVAALHLMRTLFSDYRPNQFGNELIPCCGHSLYAENEGSSVASIGCFNCIEWQVLHNKGRDEVTLTTESGASHRVGSPGYSREILRLAHEVEAFYARSVPKILPEDAIDRAGYLAFWNEWKRLRAAASSLSVTLAET